MIQSAMFCLIIDVAGLFLLFMMDILISWIRFQLAGKGERCSAVKNGRHRLKIGNKSRNLKQLCRSQKKSLAPEERQLFLIIVIYRHSKRLNDGCESAQLFIYISRDNSRQTETEIERQRIRQWIYHRVSNFITD